MAKHLGTFAVGLDGKEDPLLITDCDSHYTYIGDKELLDYTNGAVFSLGFKQTEIADEVYKEILQYGRAQIGKGFSTQNILDMGNFVCDTGGFDSYIWTCTGTSAVEAALNTADVYWKYKDQSRKYFISFVHGWHGTSHLTNTLGQHNSLVSYPSDRVLPIVSPRWKTKAERPKEEGRVLDEILTLILEHGDDINAIVFDPCPWFLTCDFSEAWWIAIRSICDSTGILMIVDDVMMGWGKSGEWHSHNKFNDVQPDISCLGKALTAGYAPLAVTVMSPKITEVVKESFYGHSFQPYLGGIGAMRATIDIIQRGNLLDTVTETEKRLKAIGDLLIDKGYSDNYRSYGLLASYDLIDYHQFQKFTKYGLSGKVKAINCVNICAPLLIDEKYFNDIESKLLLTLEQ